MLLFRKSENQIFLFLKSGIETCAIFFRNRTFLFVIRSLRYSGYLTNTSNDKEKSFVPKKKLRHVTIRDFKNKKSDFLIFWIVTCVSARNYMVTCFSSISVLLLWCSFRECLFLLRNPGWHKSLYMAWCYPFWYSASTKRVCDLIGPRQNSLLCGA